MNPTEIGIVFAYLLRWREISGNPPGRNLRDGEREVARILANCNSSALNDFEDFLNAQGFSLVDRDGVEFGIPPKAGTPNTIWVLTRKRGEDVAPYVDNRWYIEAMRDGRGGDREAKKHETIFWTARLWLTLQWFFYEKIDRLPSEVSRYSEAFVSKRLFVEELSSGIEKMGNSGRPEGEAGIVWDHFWKDKGKISTWAARFLNVMEQSGMIEATGNKDEWRQTVLAAMEMADNSSHEVSYLLPPKESLASRETAALLLGETVADQDEQR
ncbi:MAG: hypothetical protein WBJ68_17920 [Candidatus Dechloromonas phosphoritropha]|jgi:hypothetical protein